MRVRGIKIAAFEQRQAGGFEVARRHTANQGNGLVGRSGTALDGEGVGETEAAEGERVDGRDRAHAGKGRDLILHLLQKRDSVFGFGITVTG